MTDLELTILASNSSGKQTLTLTRDDEEFWFTLHGTHHGKALQFDFDCSTRSELEDIKAGIDLMLEDKS